MKLSKCRKKDMIDNLNNEIEILINIDNKDIKNKIYFLDNEYINIEFIEYLLIKFKMLELHYICMFKI